MNAVVVRVTFNDVEAAEEMLHTDVVPMVKQIPGFVAGWWTRDLDNTNGMGVIVFDSEETRRRSSNASSPTRAPAARTR